MLEREKAAPLFIVGVPRSGTTLLTSYLVSHPNIESGAETVSDCGGSATNSLVAAASYGVSCFQACKVTNDKDGIRYLNSLKEAGVTHKGNMAGADSPIFS